MNCREEVLEKLINLSEPLEWIEKQLRKMKWDYDGVPVILSSMHVVNILKLWRTGGLTSRDVENWENLIEGREDIEYDLSKYEILNNSIYHLANPVLEGELNMDLAENIINSLTLDDSKNSSDDEQKIFK